MSKTLVQINSVCNGSTGKIMQQIQEVTIASGMNSISFYGRGDPGKIGKYIRIGNDIDVKIHGVVTRLFDKHGHASIRATKKMVEQIKEIKPDVIQLHNLHGYYLNLKILFDYLKESKVKVVWTLHDCWAFTGHCSHFTFARCDKWKTGCYTCSQTAEYPKSLYIDNSKYEYNFKKEIFSGVKNLTIVTPSIWLADLVKKSFLSKYSIKVINNGIDLNIFTLKDKSIVRKKYNIENKFVILGVASIWSERKGLNYFIELSKLINSNSQIVLVGLNDKQLQTLPKNIIAISRTEDIEELVEVYSSADVFINPTLEDTFPTTNLEALACGVPVITFNTGGGVESIDESCGIIIQKSSLKGLFEASNKIIINKFDKRSCMKMATNFDKNDRFNEYIELYRQNL